MALPGREPALPLPPVDPIRIDPLVQVGLPLANGLIMFGIGMALAARDFREVADRPRSLLAGLAGHYLLLPALGFAVAAMFRDAYVLAVGFVLVAACPSASASNALTWLARGNLALAVTLTAASSLLTLLTIPLLTGLALHVFAGQAQAIELPVARMVTQLLLLVLLPVLAGMAVKQWLPAVARALEPWINRLGLAVLLLLVGWIVFDQRQALLPWMATLSLAAVGMCAAALGGGWLLARLAGADRRDAVTIGLEVGVQNCMLALLVAINVLGSVAMGMPAAVYGVLMYVLAFAYVLAARRAPGRRLTPGGGIA